MRQEFVYLTELGRMPNESLSDDESIDKLINLYDELLENITLPLSYEEAVVLVRIFPESAFYDLQWTLLRLVESMVKYENEVNYLHLISQCPSEEWRNAMMDRYKNRKKTNSKEKWKTKEKRNISQPSNKWEKCFRKKQLHFIKKIIMN